MYNEPIFLEPVFKERIWGGSKLKDQYNYNIPSNTTGECWGISAHTHGPSMIKNGTLSGLTLDKVWDSHPELFGNIQSDEYPLLVKILDAQQDLSVQVHPNDLYARNEENHPYGKTECWYIVECEENAEIVYGHHANSSEEFQSYVRDGKWSELLRRIPIKSGDFFYVPSGTIHAIGAGTLILETQQSSDITYRVYDYDRCDADGQLRELHIEKSIAVTTYPHQDAIFEQTETKIQDLIEKQLIKENYFTVYHWKLDRFVDLVQDLPFLQVSVIKGKGTLKTNGEEFAFIQGDHFILPSTMDEYSLEGDAEMIVSHVTINSGK